MAFPFMAAATLASGALSAFGQSHSNAASADLAEKQMAWQERMSNTAHQREVKDLREAGLNPILSAKYGGASTGSVNMPQMTNVAKDLPATLSTAKMLADTNLTREMAKTEQSKQNVNNAAVAATKGRMGYWLGTASNSAKSVKSAYDKYAKWSNSDNYPFKINFRDKSQKLAG